MRWLDSTIDSMDTNLSKFQEIVEDRGTYWATVHEVSKSWTGLSDWTIAKTFLSLKTQAKLVEGDSCY